MGIVNRWANQAEWLRHRVANKGAMPVSKRLARWVSQAGSRTATRLAKRGSMPPGISVAIPMALLAAALWMVLVAAGGIMMASALALPLALASYVLRGCRWLIQRAPPLHAFAEAYRNGSMDRLSQRMAWSCWVGEWFRLGANLLDAAAWMWGNICLSGAHFIAGCWMMSFAESLASRLWSLRPDARPNPRAARWMGINLFCFQNPLSGSGSSDGLQRLRSLGFANLSEADIVARASEPAGFCATIYHGIPFWISPIDHARNELHDRQGPAKNERDWFEWAAARGEAAKIAGSLPAPHRSATPGAKARL